MMKRNNEGIGGENYSDSNNDDGHQKRRRIQFEAVRLPAVANVNDVKNRTMNYQATKLRQDILYKNRRIIELEKENERAKRRQQTDENNFIKVYNLFAEIEKYVCVQVKNEFGDSVTIEPTPMGTEVQGMTSEMYIKLVEQAKQNLKIAFSAFGKARQSRNQESIAFMKKMKTLLDDPCSNARDIDKTLVDKTVNQETQIGKLGAEIKVAQDNEYNISRKRRHVSDKNALLENKVQELEQQLTELRDEADKHLRRACKFEDRLAHVVLEFQTGQVLDPSVSASGALNPTENKLQAPATPPSDATVREIESLRVERDENVNLASRRLQELEEINRKVQVLAQENAKLKMETQISSSDVICNSDEYRTLKRYYSFVVKEFERVSKELEDISNERDSLRSYERQRASLMLEEHQKTMKDIQQQSEIHNTFYRVSHDSEILRCEFETVKEEFNKTVKQSEWDEMKATLNTLRSMNKTMKSEMARLREKEKLGQKELLTLKSELKILKEYNDKCILVPIENSSSETSDDKILQENLTLRNELRLRAGGETVERQKSIEKEVERRIADKLAELETLRKTNETLTNDEQCISDELETVCIAVEEEQERNAQLFIEKREQEDRNLKMMNDRMVQNQVQNRLREKVDCLENKAQTDAQIAKMQEFQKKSTEENLVKLTESNNFKHGELARLGSLMETHRKQIADLGLAKEELKSKTDKYETQLRQVSEMYQLKQSEVEELRFKRSRAEEELETVRNKYERTKRNESTPALSGDQVLEEANRQMKETLTCPSCKTRPKDCIMLKCYHLFCETCIKTMYDTRQRKCPKCNSNFGANDFHRIFI